MLLHDNQLYKMEIIPDICPGTIHLCRCVCAQIRTLWIIRNFVEKERQRINNMRSGLGKLQEQSKIVNGCER